jgi:murein DD-endopeptidase MepM/ murein hydrolase activator NlpD
MTAGIQDISPRNEDGPADPTGPRRDGPGGGPWLALLLAAVGLVYVTARGGEGAAEPAAVPDVAPAVMHLPAAAPEVVARDTLRSGQGLGQLLRARGLEGNSFVDVLDAVRRHQSPRRLQPGVTVDLAAQVPERLSRMVLELDDDRSLHLVRGPDGWTSRLDSVPVAVDTIRVGGVIRSSLWNAGFWGDTARLAPNEDNDILDRLTQIYAWQVDFFRDIRSGDAFRVLIERELRPDGSIRRARVLAAEFLNDGRRLPAVRFVVPDGPVEYFDADGEATRKAFLRAPLKFGRKTSGFSRRRYHPILKRYRAHRGIDYGARRGTPVHATGGGTVTRAGWWNGYGRVVEVRHNGRYTTRYAHLSRVTVRRGERVQQNEVVGRVGATGLATAPHVHYEFLVHGRQRNPARVDLPPGDPVPAAHREEYRAVRDVRLELLRELELPREIRLAHRREGPGSGGGAPADE